MNKAALPQIRTFEAVSLAQMETLAAQLAALLQPGDMITLRGDLGAGKTAFARALIQPLMKLVAEVTSPTFNLMQSYDVMIRGKAEVLWHLDLYRLDDASEAEVLGLRELERHVMLIEWPEVIEHQLPASRLDIAFTFADGESRNITVMGNEDWCARLEAI